MEITKKTSDLTHCPFCKSPKIIKKGTRNKKFEKIQLYYCKFCNKKFTPNINKNKTFPLKIILDSLTQYNKLDTQEESAQKITEKYGLKITPQNISNWQKDFAEYLPFNRMRSFISQKPPYS